MIRCRPGIPRHLRRSPEVIQIISPPPATSFLVQEIDGTSKFTLEDGSGSIALE